MAANAPFYANDTSSHSPLGMTEENPKKGFLAHQRDKHLVSAKNHRVMREESKHDMGPTTISLSIGDFGPRVYDAVTRRKRIYSTRDSLIMWGGAMSNEAI